MLRITRNSFTMIFLTLLALMTSSSITAKPADTNDIKRLITALSNEDNEVRVKAAQSLIKIGKPAVEPLIAALKDKNPNVRDRAVLALGEIKDNRAVEPLIVALKEEDTGIHRAAARALGKIGDSRAVDALADILEKEGGEDPTLCNDSAEALMKIGKPSVNSLIAALKNENSQVRAEAAGALARIGDTRAIIPLTIALKDNDEFVRATAAGGLGFLKDANAVETIIGMLNERSYNVREAAIWALGEIGDKRAVESLIEKLKDEDWIPKEAAEALGKIKDSRAVEPLCSMLTRREGMGLRVRA